jgi:hypothetical protein
MPPSLNSWLPGFLDSFEAIKSKNDAGFVKKPASFLAVELLRRFFIDGADGEADVFNGLLGGGLVELAGFEFRLFAAHVDLDRVFLYTR